MVTPAERREMVSYAEKVHKLSERHVCRIFEFPRSTKRYEPGPDHNVEIKARILYWAEKRPRYGSPRIHEMVKRDGFLVNHKRTERLYDLLGLALKRKKKKRRYKAELRVPLNSPCRKSEVWSMDFISDSLASGKKMRGLNIIDMFTRECVAIEIGQNLTGFIVVQVLERVTMMEGKPAVITVDNGPEFICMALDKWAYANGVKLQFSRPGKPTDNCYIESFNGKFRDECLEANWFLDIDHAKRIAEQWRHEYNEERPHSSLDQLTPREFAAKVA